MPKGEEVPEEKQNMLISATPVKRSAQQQAQKASTHSFALEGGRACSLEQKV